MENRKFIISNKNIFLFLGIFIFNFLLIYFFVFAYSPYYTHPDITEEIAKLFNLKKTDANLKISQNEIQWMRDGAINEDEAPRWINHFYDPIHKTGWSGKYFGTLTQKQGLYEGESMAPKPAIASIDWATNQEYQSAYGRQYGNQTWQKAIKSYIDGDRKLAFIALGHILHLIEDASVPDHTRNDSHADLFGDPGSPYENYSKNYTNFNKLTIAENLKNKTLSNFLTIQSAFEYLANYSNNNFFSEDTINNNDFESPNLEKLENKIESIGNKKNLFLYDKKKQIYLAVLKENEKYSTDNTFFVLPSYFSNLSEQTVLTGAGVLNLFFQEVEKYRNNPELLPEIIPDSNEAILSYLQKSPRLALVNISDAVDKTSVNSQIYFAQAGDFFAGIFGTNDEARESQNFQPTGEISSNQQPVQYEGFQTLENQVNQSNQIAKQSSTSANENQTAIIGQTIENDIPVSTFNRQQAITEIQAQLDLIKTQAEKINQQEKQSQLAVLIPAQISYSGSGSGGGGGNPVIVVPGPIATEAQNLSIENNSTSTINHDIIIGDSNTTSTIDSTATSTMDFTPIATSTDEIATTTLIAANHIVISEIQVSGNKADDEFIEIYNLTSETVSLTDYSIQYLSGKATSTEKIGNTKKNFKNNAQIATHSFYLLVNNDATSTLLEKADMTYSFSLSGNSSGATIFLVNQSSPISNINDQSIVDYVSYGEVAIAGVSTSTIPNDNQSLERKAFYNNQCATASSSGEFLGNGCDTDNQEDFEIREIPNPQNFQNFPESRQKPTTPQNFSIEYSSSTLELIFNWEESRDYSGATSTLIYKIFELNELDFLPMIETSSTVSRIEIEEASQDYSFSIQAVDGEGLVSDFASSTIFVPEFFQPAEPTEPTEPLQNNFISDVPANDTNCYDYLIIGSSIRKPWGVNAIQGPFIFQDLFKIQTIIVQNLRRFGDFPNDVDYPFFVSLLTGDNLETVAAIAGVSISSNNLPTDFQNVSFDLSTPYQIISTSTPYWLNFSYSHAGSNNYFYELCFSGTNEQPGSVFYRNPDASNMGLKNGFNWLGDIGWAVSGWKD